jgi:tRNA(Ile)-lysidine synthase
MEHAQRQPQPPLPTSPAAKPADDLPHRVLSEARRHGLEGLLLRAPLVVGVSGGADSLALIHLLVQLRGADAARTLHIAHLNHGFRGAEGQDDARFVARLAAQWGIPHTVAHFDVPAYAHRHKLSPEDAARQVRYTFLATLARQYSATITVAHTADDQVETVLINILRGTGVSGLAGMQPLGQLPLPPAGQDPELTLLAGPQPARRVEVFRPLLSVWRRDTEQYCAQVGLQPRTDITNLDLSYRRNRIRHELLPLLQERYEPAIKEHLYALSQIASAEDRLMEELAEQVWPSTARLVQAGRSVRFDRTAFARLHPALKRRVVRRAIKLLAGTLEGVGFQHIEAACGVIEDEAAGPPATHLPLGLMVRRDDGWATLTGRVSAEEPPATDAQVWPLMDRGVEYTIHPPTVLPLAHGWQLRATVVDHPRQALPPGELTALFDLDALTALAQAGAEASGGMQARAERAAGKQPEVETPAPAPPVPVLVVRTRRPGDYIRPLGMQGRKSLQDLAVDAKMPGRIRNLIPVIALAPPEGKTEGEADGGRGGEVLWVPGPGGRRSAHAPVTSHTKRILQLQFLRTNHHRHRHRGRGA